MNNKYFIALAFTLAIILFFCGNLQAQKLLIGSKPEESELKGYDIAFCVRFNQGLRVCKAAKYETENTEEETNFVIEKNGKILSKIGTLSYHAACCEMKNFTVYQGDLDKDGSLEIIIASLEGVSNGVGIASYNVHIFSDPIKFKSTKPFTFFVEDFGEKGNFIYDKDRNETLILVTYWDWFQTIDPKRGEGFYFVGKWFRYRKNHLEPVFDNPTLARRYLNSFQNLRGQDYENPNAPFIWLQNKNTHKFYQEPKLAEKLIETKYGVIRSFEKDVFSIQLKSGETVNYGFGCCPADYELTKRLTIKDFGVLSQKFIYPSAFGFSPLMFFEKIENKKVKLEFYEGKYLKFIRLWFLEK